MSAFHCHDHVAVVTGGGTGIGQETALELLRAGASHVVITGRREEKLKETAAKAKDLQVAGKIIEHPGDITQAADRKALVKRLQAIGPVKTLVNNAGLFAYESLAETSDESLMATFDLNVIAPFALTRDLLADLKKTRGSVINISSTLAVKPIPNTSAYNGSKAAVMQITKSLAGELGADSVRVNAILPAVVETPMYRDRFDSVDEYNATIASMAKEHPLGRVGQPIDIAYAVRFLASDAASWVTGVCMPIDGGMLST